MWVCIRVFSCRGGWGKNHRDRFITHCPVRHIELTLELPPRPPKSPSTPATPREKLLVMWSCPACSAWVPNPELCCCPLTRRREARAVPALEQSPSNHRPGWQASTLHRGTCPEHGHTKQPNGGHPCSRVPKPR